MAWHLSVHNSTVPHNSHMHTALEHSNTIILYTHPGYLCALLHPPPSQISLIGIDISVNLFTPPPPPPAPCDIPDIRPMYCIHANNVVSYVIYLLSRVYDHGTDYGYYHYYRQSYTYIAILHPQSLSSLFFFLLR